MRDQGAPLVLFCNLADPDQGSVVQQLSAVHAACDRDQGDHELASRMSLTYAAACKRMAELAGRYGLAGDLWHCCLLLELVCDQNPLSLAAEGRTGSLGSLEDLLAQESLALSALWNWSFDDVERWLGVHAMRTLRSWRASKGCSISWLLGAVRAIDAAGGTPEVIARTLLDTYAAHGTGAFALTPVVGVDCAGDGTVTFVPKDLGDRPGLDDLVGYELQKERLVDNTRAFVEGRPANNVLLYGDAGTGKSTSVAALAPAYAEDGLRIVELYKHQMRALPDVLALLATRNLRFIVFIDDLSFEGEEVEYKYLKAVIEGGVAARPDNVLVYATSNRRHLIKETWSDRDDMEHDGDIHRSDTMQEKLSLAGRFGLTINYSAPNRQLYHDIVAELATRAGIAMPEADLMRLADAWEIRHGGVSGRVAAQFIDNLAATTPAP